MLATTYTALFILATAIQMLLLTERLPRTIGGALSVAFWVALIPSSYAVEIGAETGSLSTVQQPVLAFLSLIGVAVSGLYLFAAVTGRLSDTRPEVTG